VVASAAERALAASVAAEDFAAEAVAAGAANSIEWTRTKGTIMNRKRKIIRKLRRVNFTTVVTGTLLLMTISLVGVATRLVTAEPAFPQGMNPEQVAATIKANAQALKAFAYQQRMQLQLKGDVKKVTLTQISYDMYGNEQKTQLSEQPSADSSEQSSGGGRRGRLKEKVVEKKQGDFKQMMQEIVALVKSYTELPHEKMQASLKQAAFSPGEADMAGSVQILMRNVNQNGDSMTIWIDRTAMLFRRAVIATAYEGNPVTVTANYSMLPSGQVYMGQAILNYPKKEVVVEIDNSNYQRSQ